MASQSFMALYMFNYKMELNFLFIRATTAQQYSIYGFRTLTRTLNAKLSNMIQ
jgi:hypothetical protein